MTCSPWTRWLAALSCASVSFLYAEKAPQIELTVESDREIPYYHAGEEVSFRVRLSGASEALQSAKVNVSVGQMGAPLVSQGKLQLTNGEATIDATLEQPGFLAVRVALKNDNLSLSGVSAVAVDRDKILPSLPVPDDFDAFWQKQVQRLAAIPMNPRLTIVKNQAVDTVESFDVQLDGVAKGVSGYYSKPKGAAPKSLPAILLMHGAGVSSSKLDNTVVWAQRQMLALDINAHGIANGKPKQFYEALAQGELKGYRYFGRSNREANYFGDMFLRDLRALDFLCAQPEWDGKTLIVYGSSQGGYQAIATAGLDERVTLLVAGVPAGCDHTGYKVQRVNGWPKWVSRNAEGVFNEDEAETARYFDASNFAARCKAKEAIFTVGYIDGVCPPSSVYATYNALPVKKQILEEFKGTHTISAKVRAKMAQHVQRHVRGR